MYIGIDIGSSGIKATLFNEKDFYTVKTEYRGPVNSIEQDPVKISSAFCEACKKLFSLRICSPSDIKGIGLSGHGPSIVFVNSIGEASSPIVTWQDNRAEEEAKLLQKHVPGFFKNGSSYEAKVLWFYKNRKAIFEKGTTVLYPKDYILFLLCGRRVIDRSAASTIFFYNNPGVIPENPELFFPKEVLPKPVNSWEAAGITDTKYAEACGFPKGLPIYPGGIDAYCGMAGAGAVVPDIIVDETGTSTCVSRCYSGSSGPDQHVLPDLTLKMMTLSYTGGSVQWFNSLLVSERDTINALKIQPEKPVNTLFLPYLIGERSPVWDEKAQGAYIGLTDKTDKTELFQALLQGTAFAVLQNLLLLCGKKTGLFTINAVGGGAVNSDWLQLKANITGCVYKQMKNLESASIGAALVAAVGSGLIKTCDIPALLPVKQIYEPDVKVHPEYRELFMMYTELYGTLKPVFHSLHNRRIR